MVKLSFSLKPFSGHIYGQSFIKTVRDPLRFIFAKVFLSDIQGDCQGSHLEILQTYYSPEPYLRLHQFLIGRIIFRQHKYTSFKTSRPNQEPGLRCMQGIVICLKS